MASYVVAVRMDDARDFVVDPSGLEAAPSVSEEFPIGCRVRITDTAKCFLKSDTMADSLALGKWTANLKPNEGSVATVLSSATHPTDEGCVIVGIRSELDGRDFVIDAKGLTKAPHVSTKYTEGLNVRIKNAEKVYPKMDEAAKELTLSKWVTGVKPQDDEVGVVLASMAHPADAEKEVIGVRTAKGQDFVVDPEGLEAPPSVSAKFPIGCRVYITNINKLFPKMEDVAKAMNFSRWTSGVKPAVPPTTPETEEEPNKKRKLGKPFMSCAGDVKGSAAHPSGEGVVVGVRTETGQEFLVGEEGLEQVPHEAPDFPSGKRVKVANVGKVYPKFDEKAFQMSLTRWTYGETPSKVMAGKVIASVKK